MVMTDGKVPDRGRPAFSAVIFGYHDEDTILRAVRSLVEQETDGDDFEVIVATSGGDRTATLVRESFPDVAVVESVTRLLPGGVRNLGIGAAAGDAVGFLEADCIARPGWVANRIALHRLGHQAVASALSPMPGASRLDRAALYVVHPDRLAGHPAGPANPYQAYGLSLTRDLLDRAGPFDETVRSFEDTAMAERVRFLGAEPWFDPRVCIEHDGPGSLRQFVHDQYTRGARDSWAELLRLPPGRHRQRWEVLPLVRGLAVAIRALYRLLRRVRATMATVRRGHTGPPHELAGLAIPMLLGMTAFQLGWASDQLRGTRPANRRAPRDRLPLPRGLRRWVTTDGERVATLTFDGVPAPSMIAPLLAVLESKQVQAAFFVTGVEAEQRGDEIGTLAQAGHVVGCAGWSGTPFPSLPDAQLVEELARVCALLQELTGSPVGHVRPPAGAYDWRVASTLNATGLAQWLWTTHPRSVTDTGLRGSRDLAGEVLDTLTPGSVLALPTAGLGAAGVADAVAEIVDQARRRGFEFVSLDYLPPGTRSAPEPGDGTPTASPTSTSPA